jgi:hypothetical protein
MTDPIDVDPEDAAEVTRDELEQREVDLTPELPRDVPVEADEADVTEQRLDVPHDDEDDYR